jgi:hypothetical protein
MRRIGEPVWRSRVGTKETFRWISANDANYTNSMEAGLCRNIAIELRTLQVKGPPRTNPLLVSRNDAVGRTLPLTPSFVKSTTEGRPALSLGEDRRGIRIGGTVW